MTAGEENFDTRWHRWVVARNRGASRTVLTLVAIFYPLFGILDWLVAPHDRLPVLYASRVIVFVVTIAMFPIVRSSAFERLSAEITAGYMMIVGAGIGAMIYQLGGYSSPYYAGLNLVMIVGGLMFVWPARIAVAANTLVLAYYVFPNVLHGSKDQLLGAVTSFFFLFTTAAIVTSAQLFAWRNAQDSVAAQLAEELTSAKLGRANEELLRLDKFKSRFFANITHELKTPLAMILSPVELLVEGDLGSLTAPQRSTLRSVYRNGARLLKLIGDLLDLSKLEESKLRLRVAECDLVEYLRQLTSQCGALVERKQIELLFHAQSPTAMLWCDQDRLERVFVNLISNAAKFTPAGGRIDVTVEDDGARVRVEVRDNGPGFPMEASEQLFERFFQVGAETPGERFDKSGSGIGLALARELVDLHGGTIRAASAPGQGAVFTVEFKKGREHLAAEILDRRARPRDVGQDRRLSNSGLAEWTAPLTSRDDFRLLELADATERRIVERDADESQREHTVLVVEDTPDVVKVVHLVLRQHFRVHTAPNGRKGLEAAQREIPSLIITDLMMPEMDGRELTLALREDPRTRHIPIVMLTARADIDDRVSGIESGVSAYLAKPFAARELLTTVRNLVRSADAATDLALTQQMDSLETVAGGLAHEINNPLNYVKNACVRLRMDAKVLLEIARSEAPGSAERLPPIEQRMEKLFDTTLSGIERIASTVSLMGRYGREGYNRAARPHDLWAALHDVCNIVRPAIGRDVRVELNLEGDGTVECVPEEIQQVLSNLIQNAIEASPESSGRVDVVGAADERGVTIEVRDNGTGIAQEDRARIFRPFFTTKSPGRGTGMGLAIVWRVVQSHGGAVSVGGEAGSGATFTVWLPRRAEALRSSEEDDDQKRRLSPLSAATR